MDEKLIERAQALGINYSMLFMLPAKKRDAALREMIQKAEKDLVLAKLRRE